ncbi:MAG: hypothetical protein K2F65_03580 [Eubacterium sp.]|nr:hypothetical protein [Eubacterium sp.]
MELLINSDLLNKCGSGASEYWFSYRDYTVKNIRDLDTGAKPNDMGQTTYFVSIGLIPFVSISHEEIIRSLINEKGSEKLQSILDKMHGEEFIETFWKYFNAYPELQEGIDEFASQYTHKKVADWCDENNINYRFE